MRLVSEIAADLVQADEKLMACRRDGARVSRELLAALDQVANLKAKQAEMDCLTADLAHDLRTRHHEMRKALD